MEAIDFLLKQNHKFEDEVHAHTDTIIDIMDRYAESKCTELERELSEAKAEVTHWKSGYGVMESALSEAREREEAFAIKFAEWILDQNFRYYGMALSKPPTAFAYKQHPDGKPYRMTELVALFRSSLTSKEK